MIRLGWKSQGKYEFVPLQEFEGDNDHGQVKNCPEEGAGFISRISYSWVSALIKQGYKSSLKPADVWDLPDSLSSRLISSRFHAAWNAGSKFRKWRPFAWTIYSAFTRMYIKLVVMKLILSALSLLSPFVLRLLLDYVSLKNGSNQIMGFAAACGLFIISLVQGSLVHYYFWHGVKYALTVRASVICSVYAKSMSLNLNQRSTFSSGGIVNLASNDADNMMFFYWNAVHELWAAPLQILGGLILLLTLVGPSALVGFTIMVVFSPIQGGMSRLNSRTEEQAMRRNDERVRIVSEMLASMKLVKLYGLEELFDRRVAAVRAAQMAVRRRCCQFQLINRFLGALVPALVSLATFATYTILGHPLTPSTAFTALALFNNLKGPLSTLPSAVNFAVRCWVSQKRVEAFLNAPDKEQYVAGPKPVWDATRATWTNPHIQVRGSFDWGVEGSGVLALNDIDLRIGRGQLCMVVGAVGSGKSSLLHALLGEINRAEASAATTMPEKVAYTAQQPWLMNNTVRGNILFGRPYDPTRFAHAVRSCALETDLRLFPASDMTEIGEKGINVSGGQKQRIALARAVYADSDVYILDDPLAAVDAHVGKHLVEECIMGALKAKTRVMVTHQLQYLPLADLVVFMDAGRVAHCGSYQQLLDRAVKLHATPVQDLPTFGSAGPEVGPRQPSLGSAHVGLNNSEAAPAVLVTNHHAGGASHLSGAGNGHAHTQGHAHTGRRSMDGHRRSLDVPLRRASGSFRRSGELRRHGDMDVRDVASRLNALDSLYAAHRPLTPDHIAQEAHASHSGELEDGADMQDDREDDATQAGSVFRSGTLWTYPHVGSDAANATSAAKGGTGAKDAKDLKSEENVKLLPRLTEDAHAGGEVDAGGKKPAAQTVVLSIDSVLGPRNRGDGEGVVDVEEETVVAKEHHLVEVESLEVGSVRLEVYKQYFSAAGGLPVVLLVLLTAVAAEVAVVGSDWWLAHWCTSSVGMSPRDHPSELRRYIWTYASLVAVMAALVLLKVGSGLAFTLRAACRLHDSMFLSLLRARMSFFDSTPSGRVVNRFSKDQEIADCHLPGVIEDVIECAATVSGAVVVLIVVTRLGSIPLVFLAVIYYFIQQYYRRPSRQLKRLEAVSRSPIYSHMVQSSNGLVTIRALGAVEMSIGRCFELIDANSTMWYHSFAVHRWLGVRLEVLGSVVVLAASLFAILLKDTLGAGLVGLSVSSAMAMSGNLNWAVRQFTEFEVQMNAVERLLEYTRLPAEPPAVIEDARPPHGWPAHGAIDFQNLVVRYNSEDAPVLRDLTCTIRAGEKIGIVGRTGAGKSTLSLAVFRMVEASEGRVCIDGLDISAMGIHDLRSSLAIIPQEPVLFTGTIRSNLDPWDACSDAELWGILDRIQLKSFVLNLPGALDAVVDENGENMSVGQRQLICVGRAITRKSRVLIMDEATASLDLPTDHLIRHFVRTEFKHCTVLTIAHRIDSIMESDQVMVLSAGRIVEMDSPAALLAIPNGAFSQLVRDAERTPHSLPHPAQTPAPALIAIASTA